MGSSTPTTEATACDLAGQDILDLLIPCRRAPLPVTAEQIKATNTLTTQRYFAARRLAAIVERLQSCCEVEPAPAPRKAGPRASRPAPPPKAQRPLPELMTSKEACSYFGCSAKTLDRWRQRCPEIATKPMGRWRYYRDRLAALVAAPAHEAEDDLGDFITTQAGRRS